MHRMEESCPRWRTCQSADGPPTLKLIGLGCGTLPWNRAYKPHAQPGRPKNALGPTDARHSSERNDPPCPASSDGPAVVLGVEQHADGGDAAARCRRAGRCGDGRTRRRNFPAACGWLRIIPAKNSRNRRVACGAWAAGTTVSWRVDSASPFRRPHGVMILFPAAACAKTASHTVCLRQC